MAATDPDDPSAAKHGPAPDPPARRDAERIGLALRGDLPCVVCRYNLQGLSVREVCPECGTAVRATILMTVDPQAQALKPLAAPRATALGLALWSVAGFLALLLAWPPRIADLAARLTIPTPRAILAPEWLHQAILGCLAASALGALALVRPIRGGSVRASVAAVIGIGGYGLAGWAVWSVARHDAVSPWAYFVGPPSPDRLALRLVLGASIALVLLGLRPNARALVERSMALRLGRVDRQTLLAMAGAAALAAVGDGVRFLSLQCPAPIEEICDDAGILLVALGSALLTLGAGSAVVDSVRIGRAISAPSPSLSQVLGRADRRSAGAPPA